MGNNYAKEGYKNYPTCCKNREEIPTHYSDFVRMLKYIQACKLKEFKHFEYLRNYEDFDFGNITSMLMTK